MFRGHRRRLQQAQPAAAHKGRRTIGPVGTKRQASLLRRPHPQAWWRPSARTGGARAGEKFTCATFVRLPSVARMPRLTFRRWQTPESPSHHPEGSLRPDLSDDRPDERSEPPRLVPVTAGKGRHTCSYFFPDASRLIFSSTRHLGDDCPPQPDRSKGYVWPLYNYQLYTSLPDGSDVKRLSNTTRATMPKPPSAKTAASSSPPTAMVIWSCIG
jgi:hypothetical protein